MQKLFDWLWDRQGLYPFLTSRMTAKAVGHRLATQVLQTERDGGGLLQVLLHFLVMFRIKNRDLSEQPRPLLSQSRIKIRKYLLVVGIQGEQPVIGRDTRAMKQLQQSQIS